MKFHIVSPTILCRSDLTTDAMQASRFRICCSSLATKVESANFSPAPYKEKGVVYEIPHMDVDYRNVSIRRTGDS